MSLAKLINKKSLTVLGLNSGTSADAIDCAAVKISRSNKKLSIKFIHGSSIKFKADMKYEIERMMSATQIKLEDIILLDNRLGDLFGKTAASFIKRNKLKIDLIASHGQTIRHLPNKINYLKKALRGSCQLGSAEFIAQRTSVTVISDFRQADIAASGEGAPITTKAMERIFKPAQAKLIVNIGGMSNFFYFPGQSKSFSMAARDCGPGNILSDLICRQLFNLPYDRMGRMAKKGTVSKKMLAYISSQTKSSKMSKSTGRELFGSDIVKKMRIKQKKWHMTDEDLLTTAAEFTAASIYRSVRPIIKKDKKINSLYLTGGGRKNMFFVSRLKHMLPNISVVSIDELGYDGDYTEAIAYAVMGEATLRSEPLGAQRGELEQQPLQGKISQPPCK